MAKPRPHDHVSAQCDPNCHWTWSGEFQNLHPAWEDHKAHSSYPEHHLSYQG